ncbi:hypothetical protein [Clostridium brassicae]|uniref:Uncharacterized protein n=1 Tax=Clostridium brassicae TaxID=2999072 RepID=A0ABT4D6C3_9CLOT|nr:hypothetical protein [Clostridium brassicae]MCY6957822.1 hypothetical protein [Clostridium brassicae]
MEKTMNVYKGILSNKGKVFYGDDEAFDYAMSECAIQLNSCFQEDIPACKDFKEMFLEWFYSDNWVVDKYEC